MKKFNVKISEAAAQCVTAGTVFRRTTTELYDLYNHPEDMQLYIQIVGDDRNNIPDVYIEDVSLKDLHYALSQLNNTALNNCIVWLRAYDGDVLQEFAVVCEAQHNDFAVNNCNFRLCPFAVWSSDEPASWEDIMVCHEDEVCELMNNIKNIINNRNK